MILNQNKYQLLFELKTDHLEEKISLINVQILQINKPNLKTRIN